MLQVYKLKESHKRLSIRSYVNPIHREIHGGILLIIQIGSNILSKKCNYLYLNLLDLREFFGILQFTSFISFDWCDNFKYRTHSSLPCLMQQQDV